MGYQSYKDLEIYQLAHKLAVEVHKFSLTLPKFEMYEEASQLRKSSKSICSNTVEGFGRRRYKNEFIQFLTYSLASCDETREHLDLLFETESLKDKEGYDYFTGRYEELGKKLTKFIQAVEAGHLKPKTRIKDLARTRIKGQGSRIKDPGSRIKDQGSRI
jgi:four helix bundle protein